MTPVTATSACGTRDAIGGITVSRKVCSAAIETALSPLPAIAKPILHDAPCPVLVVRRGPETLLHPDALEYATTAS